MGQQPREQTYDELDVLFETSTRKDMVKHERLWRDAGWVVSWVDRRPKYTCTVDWGGSVDIVVGMTGPGERSWRFSMIGGGVIEVSETWHAPAWWMPKLGVRLCRTVLRVVTQPNGARRVYVGKLESVGGEMWAHAVLMPRYAMFAQPVADRVAQTLRAHRRRRAERRRQVHGSRAREVLCAFGRIARLRHLSLPAHRRISDVDRRRSRLRSSMEHPLHLRSCGGACEAAG
jgi:hypothetical protein